MPEVLEIQIQDKGGSGLNGPPRPPSASSAALQGPGASSGTMPVHGHAGPTLDAKGGDAVGGLMNQLGLGKLFKAMQTLAGYSAAAPATPKSPAVPSVMSAPPKSPAANVSAAAPATPKPPAVPSVVKAPAESAVTAEAATGIEAVGGALSGLAAAAGPIGAALVVADVAADQMAKGFDRVRENVELFGHQLADAAGNNYLGMFKKGLDSIHSPLKDIPIVGKVYEAQLQAAIAPVKAFTEVVDAFNKRASELAGFSPNIAVAEQMGSIREILDDFKEAQELGPDLARMIDAQNSLQHELREILLPLKKVVVDVLADVLEGVQSLVEYVRALIEAIQAWMKENKEKTSTALQILDVAANGPLPAIARYLFNIQENTEAKKKKVDAEIWLKELNKAQPLFAGMLMPEHDPRPNIPIVNAFGGI